MDALTRVKPLIAILIDVLADEAESDIFLARARKKGVHLLLFGGAAAAKARRPWADARGIPVYTLPDEVLALEESIRKIAAGAGKSTRSFERRDRTQVSPLVVQDRSGTKWSVYDRRSADRRKYVIDREFVSETGEVRHCHIDEQEAERTSPEALMDQLERATSEGKG